MDIEQNLSAGDSDTGAEGEECSFPSQWYELGGEEHFWFQWRLCAFLKQIETLPIPIGSPMRFLDIGCGHGVLRRQLEKHTAWTIDGTDLNSDILHMDSFFRGETMLYDIMDKRKDLREFYDGLFLFDIIEHIVDTTAFIEAALYHLKPKGWVFINVPAIEILYSFYDEVAGHIRRYDKRLLYRTVKNHPAEIQDMRYWGFCMIPVLLFRKLLLTKKMDDKTALQMGFQPKFEFINKIFKMMMKIETSALPTPFLGTSLIASVQKSN
ncbi:class I SAM-dependent methyltransferase [Thermodesulfobacteriota bacterium]